MKCKILSFLSLFFFSSVVLATPTFIDVSDNLQSPLDFVMYGLMIIALLISFGFFIGTLFLYRRHCETPVHVPLFQVIFCFILAVLTGVIPYILSVYKGYELFSSIDQFTAQSELERQPSRRKNLMVEGKDELAPSQQEEPEKKQRPKKLWQD